MSEADVSAGTDALDVVLRAPGRADRLRHVHHVAARAGTTAPWPAWCDPRLVSSLRRTGVAAPWLHQARAAELAHAGTSVVVATGTGSGKSLAFWLPAVTAALQPRLPCEQRGATVLYLSPTKALAADQAEALCALGLDDLLVATLDGDTPREQRDWVRGCARYVLTNPDLLHRTLLPSHPRWAPLLRSLRYVVVDECHAYRGVFGSHVAAVLRRLRRICARYGSSPTFVLASATVSDPASSAARLTGLPVAVVEEDFSARGSISFALWEPPLTELAGENGASVRRTATAETADLLADLVAAGRRTLAFVRSRRGAESVALSARRLLSEVDPSLPGRVAPYRAGYLPEDRRALERRLRGGDLLGVSSTNALELGVDVSGLDAVLIAGWPGTRASLMQQAGRAGRAGADGLAVLVARADPLDTYVVAHPEAIFGRPLEATVLDPSNPYVLAPHLCAAAAEMPICESDLELFGTRSEELLGRLAADGALRRRPGGWYWVRGDRPCDLTDLRGAGGPAVRVVERVTGRLLGTVDAAAAHTTVHEGAVYLHQGETYVVASLDLEAGVALVDADQPDWTTSAREITDIRVLGVTRRQRLGAGIVSLGTVEVTAQVVGFLLRRVVTGEVLGEVPLDLPERRLRTTSVWWTLDDQACAASGVPERDLAGAAHAAEHAAIGLLPLVATCDRWDVGGVSTVRHPDTNELTVFVHDGHPGGAGFAERGYDSARQWLCATREAVAGCECDSGCPSCVQSPKCGNGNEPLSKSGAVRLLDLLRVDDIP